jgi:hypothetical protein
MDPKSVPSKIIERAPVGPLSPYIESYTANDYTFRVSIEPLVLRSIVGRFVLRRLFSRGQVNLMILFHLIGVMRKKKAK